MKQAEKLAAGAEGPEASKDGRGKRYGEAVKRQVVEQIERGKLTVSQAQRQFGIAGSQTIAGWLKRYGKAGGGSRPGTARGSAAASAQARIERLEREKAELERTLARVTVKAAALEALVEEAEAHYGPEFKKNCGAGPSNGRATGSGSRG